MSGHAPRKRIPVSCENCRKRKIACSGGYAPCQTCIKRGFASTCHFVKDAVLQSQSIRQPSESSQALLLQRISSLEALLHKSIEVTRQKIASEGRRDEVACISPISSNASREHGYVHTGRLIHTSSGHVQYVLMDEAFRELEREGNASSPGQTCSDNFPFSASSSMTQPQILELLPPLSYCDVLKTSYMQHFSPLFHILHDPSFEKEYQTFQKDPSGTRLSFLALIFVVLAIGVTALEDDHYVLSELGREAVPGKNTRKVAGKFRDATMRALSADGFMWRHDLRTLQTLVLLIYAFSHARIPAWSLLGTTLNIAIAIGCHVDPSRYNVSLVEAEERRRCWAALTMLYTIQDTCMGNLSPMTIQADIAMPADVDDETLSAINSFEDFRAVQPPARPSKMAYLLFKFRLYRLASNICTFSASGKWQYSLALGLDQDLAMEEASQKARFENLQGLPLYHQVHYYILSNYTNHLYLILHRPCLVVHAQGQGSQLESAQEHSIIMDRLYSASVTILDNHAALHTNRDFRPYRWYIYGLGSFHAFLAATTIATLVGQPEFRAQVDVLALRDKLCRCWNIFQENSERNEISARAANILARFFGLDSEGTQSLYSATSDSSGPSPADRPQTDRTVALSTGDQQPILVEASWRDEGYQTGAVQQTSHPYMNPGATNMDWWTANLDLQNALSGVTCQQWLSPTYFPWESCAGPESVAY